MAQEKAFKEPVPSNGTRWDGLLAAMVEHIARLHDLEAPRGATNRSASWKDTVVFSPVRSVRSIRSDALMFAPAAFLRRGAVPDPRDMDSRRGEAEEWVT